MQQDLTDQELTGELRCWRRITAAICWPNLPALAHLPLPARDIDE